MNVNTYSILTSGYNQATALRDRYTDTNRISNETAPRTYTSSDAAIVESSANGDVLEVSESSAAMLASVVATSGLAAFNAPQSGVDFYRAVIQHLRDNNHNTDAHQLEIIVNQLAPRLTAIQNTTEQIADLEGILAQLTAQFEAHSQELQDMEDNIEAQENYLESIGDTIGAVEDAIATEEDRLDELASVLEEVLEREVERLEDRFERLNDRFETRLDRRLDRLARRQARFEARMDRRQAIEDNRRLEFEERISSLVPGSPEYEAARANENRRRARFDANMVRRTERHDRSMTRAWERHNRWLGRQQGQLGGMQDNITQRMEANEARVEEVRTSSSTIDNLTQHIEVLEAQQAAVEAYITLLQTQFEERQRELEPIMENLEDVQMASIESEIEAITETLTLQQQLAAGAQAQVNNALEALRQAGMLPNQ